MKFMMFSKHLGHWAVVDAARKMRELGFDGMDLTVRGGGHVLPENADRQLGQVIETVRAEGLEVGLLTTSVLRGDEPYAVDIFEAAARAGVREVKLGYWKYEGLGTIQAAVEKASRDLDSVEMLAERTGVRANIHNHSGQYISGSVPLVWHWLNNRNPVALGAYFDPCHAVIEGGYGGWRMGMDLVAKRINVVSEKDAVWASKVELGSDKPRWFPKMVPPSLGITPWREVFGNLKAVGFDGWISVQFEYWGVEPWKTWTADQRDEQVRADLAYLRALA